MMITGQDQNAEIHGHLRSGFQRLEGEITMVRKRIVFRGWVQGVGFRYRARYAADYLGVTGWVRNKYDGSVTMKIQGTEEQIDGVILAIERGQHVRIEKMDVETIPVEPHEQGFWTR